MRRVRMWVGVRLTYYGVWIAMGQKRKVSLTWRDKDGNTLYVTKFGREY